MELLCPFDIKLLNDKDFLCLDCKKCFDNKNKINEFSKDLNTAIIFEEALKSYIEKNTNLFFKDLKILKNPDLSFFSVFESEKLICRIEAKFLNGQAAVYMKNIIGLEGKETLVVDEPKLNSYIKRHEEDNKNSVYYIPTFIVWFFGRPCEDFNNITVYQEIRELKNIYFDEKYNKRKFERKTTSSDIVDNQKKGITKKFHFSIKETKPIFYLVPEIFEYLSIHKKVFNIISELKNLQKKLNVQDFIESEDNLYIILNNYEYTLVFDYLYKIFDKLKVEQNNHKFFIFNVLFNLDKIKERLEGLK